MITDNLVSTHLLSRLFHFLHSTLNSSIKKAFISHRYNLFYIYRLSKCAEKAFSWDQLWFITESSCSPSSPQTSPFMGILLIFNTLLSPCWTHGTSHKRTLEVSACLHHHFRHQHVKTQLTWTKFSIFGSCLFLEKNQSPQIFHMRTFHMPCMFFVFFLFSLLLLF